MRLAVLFSFLVLVSAAGCNDDDGGGSGPDLSTGSDGGGGGGRDLSTDGGGGGSGGDDGGSDEDGGVVPGGDMSSVPGDPSTGAWQPGFGLPGISGPVRALVSGGNGIVYAGGSFTSAGGVPALNVARWTGTKWEALGAGIDGDIYALTVDSAGTLFAGGDLGDSAGARPNRLARWDGHAWTFVDGALSGGFGGVRGLAAYKDGIAVGGGFESAGGVVTPGIALYATGAANPGWRKLGDAGVDRDAGVAAVTAFGNGFCIGGSFATVGGVAVENAACWDGTRWAPLGKGLPAGIDLLVRSPGGVWFAGGTFTFEIDPDNGIFETGLATLEGQTWTSFHGGVDLGDVTQVRGIAFVGNDVIVGGNFAGAGGQVAARNLARWNPTDGWRDLVGPVVGEVGVALGANFGVHDLLVVDGNLWVGGLYTSVGTTIVSNVARIAGDSASPVVAAGSRCNGVVGDISALAVDKSGGIVAGGHFRGTGAGLARNLARFDGTTWSELGGGVDTGGGWVKRLLVRRDGTLVVAGDLVAAGSVTVSGVATWNGSSWDALGGGVDGSVSALAEDDAGNLYVGGEFETAGGVTVHNVARWGGAKWLPVGDGFDDEVRALAWLGDGKLAAGGRFKASGAVALANLAVWNGSAWAPLGGGVSGGGLLKGIEDLVATAQFGLVAAGNFKKLGDVAVTNIASWDGSAWHPIGAGLDTRDGFGASVARVQASAAGLFATGNFGVSGSTQGLRFVAWWDGAAWRPLGAGLDDLGESLALAPGRVYVGGPFLGTGDGLTSTSIAVWVY